jgi:toxin-antitoxin system PIN domain toxin
MTLTKPPRYLVDVNALIAFLDEDHIHHELAKQWFQSPGLHWSICPFVEAGLLRHLVRPRTGGLSIAAATQALSRLRQWPGYRYQPIDSDWQTLTQPFAKRLFGHRQITDAFLLGLAIRHGLILVTFDRAMLHLAGEYTNHILLLEPPRP